MQAEIQNVRVQVKWGSEKFSDVPIDINAPIEKFRRLLQELSGVPALKQKIIYKGQTLKDDVDLVKLNLKDGALIMLMGQTEANSLNQTGQKQVFIEDLTPQERARILKEKAGVKQFKIQNKQIILPTGLYNLGNTCYLNSSVQCLKRVTELREYLANTKNPQGTPESVQLFKATQGLFQSLEHKGEAFKPSEFVMKFMMIFPMFAERQQNGVFKQQDADECFQNILQTLEPLTAFENEEGQKRNLIRDLFEIKSVASLQNLDIPEEPISYTEERTKKLMCIIDNESQPVNTLAEGIKVSLQGQLEKTSQIDGQNHIYQRTVKINNLPNYLLVQMVRFFWKQGVNGNEGTKSKILRNVGFPKILDLYEFCTPELQENLKAGRDYEKKLLLDNTKIEHDQFEQFKKDLEAKGEMIPDDTKEIYKRFKEQKKEQEIKKHDDLLYRKHGYGLDTGNYEIIGVLSKRKLFQSLNQAHKGREADAGHYVAWIHVTGDQWVCYDDDQVTEVNIEKILDLRGGGDWHMGYYLIYRKLEIE